jgi:hypothetical protein
MENLPSAVLTLLFILSKVIFVNSHQGREENLFINNRLLMVYHQPNLRKSPREENQKKQQHNVQFKALPLPK